MQKVAIEGGALAYAAHLLVHDENDSVRVRADMCVVLHVVLHVPFMSVTLEDHSTHDAFINFAGKSSMGCVLFNSELPCWRG